MPKDVLPSKSHSQVHKPSGGRDGGRKPGGLGLVFDSEGKRGADGKGEGERDGGRGSEGGQGRAGGVICSQV